MSSVRRADVAYAAGVIVGIAFLVASGALAVHDRQIMTRDFAGIWTGSRAILDGHDPYDAATWRSVAATYGTQLPDTDVYGYPRWVPLALLPLALLPLDLAAAIWLWGGIALAILAVRALLRATLPGKALAQALVGGTLFVAQPGYQSVVNGQWTFLLLAASSATFVLLRRSRHRAAAVAALSWLAKPQLFIGYAIGGARWDRAFARWAVALAAAVAFAATVTAPGWLPAWSTRVAPVRIVAPATLYAAATDLLGVAGLVAAAMLVIAGVALCLR
ncbi:MAG: glycosyltransferase 87 family protein, partial [Chloroflexota bacterium]|nr:glycosyltransferase 87 family protein [Chloroflexota bacterium]